jgi:predicted O-linked N-acetylglucosamine transferase (SPINDLY family)
MLGVLVLQQGDAASSIALLERAVAGCPADARLLTNLGVAYRGAGQDDAAERSYRQALAADSGSVNARFNLANLYADGNSLDAALDLYEEAHALDPGNISVLNNLATALEKVGRLQEAENRFRALVALQPGNAAAHANLGAMCATRGRTGDAIDAYRRALALDRTCPQTLANFGNALLSLRRYGEALAAFDEAIANDDGLAEPHYGRGLALAAQGDVDGAAAALDAAITIDPLPRYRFARAGLQPVIPESAEAIEYWRAQFRDGLDALRREGVRLDGTPLQLSLMNFYLAYDGQDDRPLMEALSALLRSACPALDWTAPHCREACGETRRDGRLRVGFVSAYLREHAVLWTMRGVIEALAGEGFDIHLFVAGTADDPPDDVRNRVAGIHPLARHLENARETIAAVAPDVLIYADIGMDWLSYCLAHARLAPVQCAIWGHPVTTGIPSVDYYLSSDLAEPGDAAAHYSETLVRLGGIQTCYRKPAEPAPRALRDELHVPADASVYLCPQSLFKIHPDMDACLADILRRDPAGVLVLFHGSDPAHAARLAARWRPVFGDAFERVHFLPRAPFDDFMATLAAADVLLDTWPFGGGNTSYQGFAVGVPIVTLAGDFLRGRGAFALYRAMGIDDCIAQTPASYADIALRLGRDSAFRADVTASIRARSDVIFDDRRVVDDLAAFLRDAAG